MPANSRWDLIRRLRVKKGQGGKEHHPYNKTKEGQLDWSHLAQKLPSEARY